MKGTLFLSGLCIYVYYRPYRVVISSSDARISGG